MRRISVIVGVALSLVHAPLRAQSGDANDAAGWGAPAPAPAAAAAGNEAESGSPDDAAGWGGGESSTPAADSDEPEATSSTTLQLTGRLRMRVAARALHLREEPLAQARGGLDLALRLTHEFGSHAGALVLRAQAAAHADADIVYAIDRARYDAATVETYARQLYPAETYVALANAHFEAKAGWLTAALGQGEILGSNDVLNPRDLREPGLAEADLLRMPVLASKLSLSANPHRLEAFIVHEAFFGLTPPPLGEFSPLRKLLAGDSNLGMQLTTHEWRYQHAPRGFDPSSWQALGRYTFSGSGLDIELQGGSVLDRLGTSTMPPPAAFDFARVAIDVVHPRYTALATAGAWAIGAFLVRWELGLDLGRPQALRVDDSPVLQFDAQRLDQLNFLVGLTYFGIESVNVGVEASKSYVFNSPDRAPALQRSLLWPVEATNVALRWTQSFLDEQLQLSLIVVVFGVYPFNSGFARAELGYVLAEGARLDVGYIHYQAGDSFGPLFGLDKNDRAYLNFTWDFGL